MRSPILALAGGLPLVESPSMEDPGRDDIPPNLRPYAPWRRIEDILDAYGEIILWAVFVIAVSWRIVAIVIGYISW